jgi:hypothetical protein
MKRLCTSLPDGSGTCRKHSERAPVAPGHIADYGSLVNGFGSEGRTTREDRRRRAAHPPRRRDEQRSEPLAAASNVPGRNVLRDGAWSPHSRTIRPSYTRSTSPWPQGARSSNPVPLTPPGHAAARELSGFAGLPTHGIAELVLYARVRRRVHGCRI